MMMKNTKIYLLCLLTAICCIHCAPEDTIEMQEIITSMGAEIHGSVLIDTDEDGIGDEAVENEVVFYGQLGLIPDTLNPDPDVLWTYTDSNGNYSFEGLPPSTEKVVTLNPNTVLFSVEGIDATPDGDPLEEESSFWIDIELEENEIDDGNNFLALLDPCDEPFTISPICVNPCDSIWYPIACFYDNIPNLFAQAGPNTSLEWTNHTQNINHTSDIIYISPMDSVTLEITFTTAPDSCIYIIEFKDDCQ